MSEHKRTASTFAAMEASSGATFSKKRKTTSLASCQFQLRSNSRRRHLPTSHLHDAALSPAAATSAVNSDATVVSGSFPLTTTSCSSTETSDVVKDSTAAALDLEANAVDSTFSNIKLFSKDKCWLSECSGDSEEASTTVFPAAEMAPKEEEIEEFFAMAEKYEQKRFAEKYNYDIVTDMPLQESDSFQPLAELEGIILFH
ncbi:cyclin-dependent kinase inhibitor 7-like [Senna tora]|uniref:Cyclin-dependent kinase inhibitor n=1 Tax=Senna tora TaxID=362788 RepID=A0A834SWJ7_9FABA|nr:cyclin-dependent kinase inhibitor 7-like [Senna tora]